MSMLVSSSNSVGGFRLYCTHCQFNYPGFPAEVYHPRYSEFAQSLSLFTARVNRDSSFLDKLKTCPHAGKTFRAPEAVQLMDEKGLHDLVEK